MSIETGNPFSPMGRLVRVRLEYQVVVAAMHGEIYACSNLALRERKGEQCLYAPVAIAPGNIAAFIWPAAAINDAWVEAAKSP